MKNVITEEMTEKFEADLRSEEKSPHTVEKYLRDVRAFTVFLADKDLTKAEVIAYKNRIICEYAPTSVNSMLASVNAFLRYIDRGDCCVKPLRIQRQLFAREEKELSSEEYRRLVNAAKGNRISYIVQTICGTGIRVSELRYITVEAVREGRATVNCKNKTRTIFLSAKVRKILRESNRSNCDVEVFIGFEKNAIEAFKDVDVTFNQDSVILASAHDRTEDTLDSFDFFLDVDGAPTDYIKSDELGIVLVSIAATDEEVVEEPTVADPEESGEHEHHFVYDQFGRLVCSGCNYIEHDVCIDLDEDGLCDDCGFERDFCPECHLAGDCECT